MHIAKTEKIDITVGNIIFSFDKNEEEVTVKSAGYGTIDIENIHELRKVPDIISAFINDQDITEHM